MPDPDLFLFVSHVREDRQAALDIVNELERRGVSCWIAPRDVRPGKPFDDEIAEAIETCRAMLLIFSDHCNEHEYIRREITVAGESHKIIIPFRIEDAQPRRGLRIRLSDLHWIDGFVSRERAIDQVIRAVDPDQAWQREGQRREQENAPRPQQGMQVQDWKQPQSPASLEPATAPQIAPAAPDECRTQRTLTGHTNNVTSVAFSPNGCALVSGSTDKTIKLWDAASGQLLRTLTGHANSVSPVAFSPDGRTLVSGSADKTIKLWDAASGQLVRTLTGHADAVSSVAFSPDGRALASGSRDKTIKLWDAASGQLLRTLTGHAYFVSSVAFSPDGRALASGSWDKTIKLWDAASGQLLRRRLLRTLTGHTEGVIHVAFSPNGRTLVSGSTDKTIKLWDAASGQLLRTLTGHTGQLFSIAFSPDGRAFASGSWDKTIKLWDAASGQLLRTLTGRVEFRHFRRVFAGRARLRLRELGQDHQAVGCGGDH